MRKWDISDKNDCTDTIERLLSCMDLRTERMKLYYCRGRALYYKGEIESEKGCFRRALSDFLTVAQDRIRTDRDMRAVAWHFYSKLTRTDF